MPVRSQTFDSSGPDVRIRGNAYQVLEKYLALARDATAAGDRIAAENFYQHAEHYYRVINANGEHHRQQQQQHQQMHAHGQDGRGAPSYDGQHQNGSGGNGQQSGGPQPGMGTSHPQAAASNQPGRSNPDYPAAPDRQSE